MMRDCWSGALCALLFLVPVRVSGQTAAAQHPPSGGRTIRGTVYDSLAKAPLAGATVMLLDRSDSTQPARTVVADSVGRFEVHALPAGFYLIGFEHPLLDSLGITTRPRQVVLAPNNTGALEVNLGVPSATTVRDAFCPRRGTNDSTSALIGHLYDATTRGTVVNGAVDVQWLGILRTQNRVSVHTVRTTAHSGPDGWYVVCGLPPNTPIAMQATLDADSSGLVRLMTEKTAGLLRRELYLASTRQTALGRISGTVLSAEGNRPVANAQVRAAGDTTTATTRADGTFSLDRVRYGTISVSARSIGFLPQDVAVDVLADQPARVHFSLMTAANMLDTVRAYAVRTLAEEDGFDERRKSGWGHFFDAEAIERMRPFATSDIVKRVPGLRIQTVGFDSYITMRHGCVMLGGTPAYFLDGRELMGIETTRDLEIMAPVDELAAVEVYNDDVSTPAQFRLFGKCGAIVMWSLPPDLYGKGGH